ncbi:hypothetical protein KW795_00680 [Candidatus Microgenomates bacterium]|nr:hypothetical protein [Candidatus Microgenomates bacterium]
MLKKVLLVFVLVLGFMLLTSGKSEAHAATTNGSLRHAYKPYTVSTTRAMRARVDNFAPESKSRLVCVEAFRTSNGAKTHLGCLDIPLAAYKSNDQWAFEFDAPTYWLDSGTYRVVYTYRDDWGKWHQVKSVTLQVTNGSYSAM